MTRLEVSPADRAVPLPDVSPAAVPPARTQGRDGGVPEIIRRRLAPVERRLDPWSWVVAGLVTMIGGIVRLVDLDRPGRIIFDETYYAPEAYGLLRHGVEWQVREGGAQPVDGAPVLGEGAAYVVHPPLGKWLIGTGEWIFGYDPFGWRIAAVVAGLAIILMVTRIGRRMFGSTLLGGMAGLLIAFDGMHFVLSRTALLDIFLLFFLVAAFGAVLLDRDQRRARWLAAIRDGLDRPPGGWRGLPWWRFAAAGLLGAALGVKWSAVFFIPVFALLVVLWEVGARRSAGVRTPRAGMALDEAWTLAVSAAIIPVVYLASWTGWFATDHGYFRHWRASTGQSEPPVLGALLNLIHYHQQALSFHLPLASDHVYASAAWQWLLLARPVAFHWSAAGSCGGSECASMVLLVGTPVLWWAFLPAVAAAAWLGLARRDWRVAPILLAAAAGIVPWFFFPDRVMFYFYALPAEPFLVLALVYVIGAMVSPRVGRLRSGPPPSLLGLDRRTVAVLAAGAYVLLVALNFAYFYPILTGQVIPYEAWQARIWVSSWV